MIRIQADFNALTRDGSRVQLPTILPEEVKPGLRVMLYEPDDFEVEATIEKVRLESGLEIWYGIIHRDTFRDL